MLSRLRAHLPAWRRALRRRRRLLAALAIAAVLAALLPSMLPPSARGIEVIVTAAPLAPGTVLTPEHLTTTRIAAELVPAGTALEAEQVLGRTTLLPLEPGTPLLPGLLQAPDTAEIPTGSVLMAVPVPVALVPYLPRGTGIALLSTDPILFDGSSIPAQVLEVLEPGSPSPARGAAMSGTVEALVTIEQEHAGEVAHALGVGAIVVTVIG